MVRASFLRLVLLAAPTAVLSFVVPWTAVRAPVSSVGARPRLLSHAPSMPFRVGAPRGASNNQEEQTLTLVPALDDAKVRALFAWLSRAFAGDERYNNLMYALAAIWADNLEEGSGLSAMVADALKGLPDDEDVMLGAPLSLAERERASLGAMGAGQWMGQYRTRPHALLDVRELGDADEWAKGLPRGCRRTLAKAAAQNFTTTSRRIVGGMPAPHSSLAHFRCVVEARSCAQLVFSTPSQRVMRPHRQLWAAGGDSFGVTNCAAVAAARGAAAVGRRGRRRRRVLQCARAGHQPLRGHDAAGRRDRRVPRRGDGPRDRVRARDPQGGVVTRRASRVALESRTAIRRRRGAKALRVRPGGGGAAWGGLRPPSEAPRRRRAGAPQDCLASATNEDDSPSSHATHRHTRHCSSARGASGAANGWFHATLSRGAWRRLLVVVDDRGALF